MPSIVEKLAPIQIESQNDRDALPAHPKKKGRLESPLSSHTGSPTPVKIEPDDEDMLTESFDKQLPIASTSTTILPSAAKAKRVKGKRKCWVSKSCYIQVVLAPSQSNCYLLCKYTVCQHTCHFLHHTDAIVHNSRPPA